MTVRPLPFICVESSEKNTKKGAASVRHLLFKKKNNTHLTNVFLTIFVGWFYKNV